LLSRPPLERMLRIHQAIHSGKYPNATTLAGELEVSTKSIYRDIEFMRDRLELPVEFDGARNGFHYTEEVSNFPTLQITEGELFALLVAEKALQQYRGTTFEKPLLSAFKKMAASLPDTVSLNLADWEQTISFRTSAEPILNVDSFEVVTSQDQFGVVIRFDELVADYVREKRWHPSQQLIELEDGSVELRLKLSSLVEIQRWILSWGGHANALAPDELAESVKAAAEMILERAGQG